MRLILHTAAYWPMLAVCNAIPGLQPLARPVDSMICSQIPILPEAEYFEPQFDPVEGNVMISAIPARFSKSSPNVHRPWPALREHTGKISAEAAFSESNVKEIVDHQAVL